MQSITKRELELFTHTLCRMNNNRIIKSMMTGMIERKYGKGRLCRVDRRHKSRENMGKEDCAEWIEDINREKIWERKTAQSG